MLKKGKVSMRFIYITPFFEEDFFSEVKRGMHDAAAMLGVTAKFTGTHEADFSALSDMIKRAVDQGISGLAVSMPRSGELDEAVQSAMDKGIPVVSFNIDNPQSARMACVCQDFYSAGIRLGELIRDRLPAKARVLLTMHDAGVTALDERVQGIKDAVSAARSDVVFKTVVTGNTPELAQKTLTAELLAGAEAMLCTGQSDTHGAGLAVRALPEYRGTVIAGFDVCKEIRQMVDEGVIDFTIDQQPYVQGFYPLLMMHQSIVHGVKPFDIDTGCDIIEPCRSR